MSTKLIGPREKANPEEALSRAGAKAFLRSFIETSGTFLAIAVAFAVLGMIILALNDYFDVQWKTPPNGEQPWHRKTMLSLLGQHKTLFYISALFVVFSFAFPTFHKLVDQMIVPRIVGAFEAGFDKLKTALREALGGLDEELKHKTIAHLIDTSPKLKPDELADIGRKGLERFYGFRNGVLTEVEQSYLAFLHKTFANPFYFSEPVYYQDFNVDIMLDACAAARADDRWKDAYARWTGTTFWTYSSVRDDKKTLKAFSNCRVDPSHLEAALMELDLNITIGEPGAPDYVAFEFAKRRDEVDVGALRRTGAVDANPFSVSFANGVLEISFSREISVRQSVDIPITLYERSLIKRSENYYMANIAHPAAEFYLKFALSEALLNQGFRLLDATFSPHIYPPSSPESGRHRTSLIKKDRMVVISHRIWVLPGTVTVVEWTSASGDQNEINESLSKALQSSEGTL
jgi:hypothetical protein